MKIVVTVVGQDRVGIIATVSAMLAENQVNIVNINQNIVEGFFNMVLIGDMTQAKIQIRDLQALLKQKGDDMGLQIRVQHEDIFRSMHRI